MLRVDLPPPSCQGPEWQGRAWEMGLGLLRCGVHVLLVMPPRRPYGGGALGRWVGSRGCRAQGMGGCHRAWEGPCRGREGAPGGWPREPGCCAAGDAQHCRGPPGRVPGPAACQTPCCRAAGGMGAGGCPQPVFLEGLRAKEPAGVLSSSSLFHGKVDAASSGKGQPLRVHPQRGAGPEPEAGSSCKRTSS